MSRAKALPFMALAAALLAAGSAAAQDEPALCTDRPTKANAVCTVPDGRWQVEADAVNVTRFDAGPSRTDTTAFAGTTLKYGLDDRSDLEVTWAPVVQVETRLPGASDTQRGVGDVTLRYKRRLTADGAGVGVAVIPFVKLPTAPRGIGNRAVEGGVALPVSLAAPNGFTVALGPEVDLLLDADGQGRHAQLVNLVNIAHAAGPRLTLAAELWTATNFDPAGDVTQASADIAAAWSLDGRVQLDAGANFGLNADTPDVQVYVGASRRF